MHRPSCPLALASFTACLVITSHAGAQDSTSADAVEPRVGPFRLDLGLGAAFGNVKLPTGESTNTYGAGASLRGGYVFRFGGFLALRFEHFLGTSADYVYPSVATTTYRAGAEFLGGEVGYELNLPHAFLRPHVGVGAGWLTRTGSCSAAHSSWGTIPDQTCSVTLSRAESGGSWNLSVAPGLTMGVTFAKWRVFVEPRYYFRDSAGAYGIFGGVGLAL